MSLAVSPLSESIGAEVTGLDLRRSLAPAEVRALEAALLEHIVLVLRGQRLAPAELVAAMRSFGTPARQNHSAQLLDGHPEIWVIDSREAERAADGTRLLVGANCWHTDHTNQLRPPKITVLYPVELPPSGGDTRFANAYELYEGLPAALRGRVDGMRTVNGADRHLRHRPADAAAFATPAIHPLVRTHPQTGRRALYLHPLKMQRIEGMAPDESIAFVDALIERAIASTRTYQHRWRLGDLVLIDNRACMHLALRDYDAEAGRVMHRVIIEGERPV